MPRETVILECTEARKEGKPPSRYMASRNKKLQTEAVEKEVQSISSQTYPSPGNKELILSN